jgi:transposase
MGQKLEVDWQETAPELRRLYRQERNSERRTRLHALWQLRCGKSLKEVTQLVGMAYRTLQYWVAWYRKGGLSEVLSRIKGHGRQGRPSKLQPLQQRALAAKVALGAFRTVWDALQWVQDRWKVGYSYSGLHKCLKRLDCRSKVPRPRSINADVAAHVKNGGNCPRINEMRGPAITGRKVHSTTGRFRSQASPPPVRHGMARPRLLVWDDRADRRDASL